MFLLSVVCIITYIQCGNGDHVQNDMASSVNRRQRRDVESPVKILEMLVTSNVSLRFAKVDMMTTIKNRADTDEETVLTLWLPKSAFISEVTLKIGNKTISGNVKEKKQASVEYEKAKDEDVSAGHVTQQSTLSDDFDRDIFQISVNIANRSTVLLHVQYYELIVRNAKIFSQKIYIDPGKVEKLDVVAEYKETEAFKSFKYTTPFSVEIESDNQAGESTKTSINRRKINWSLSEEEKEGIINGIRPLEVSYELETEQNGGHVALASTGNFVLFFSTNCKTVMSKQIVFVIDKSGSMDGKAITQVKRAMLVILENLREDDYFNIIVFDKTVGNFENELIRANVFNIERSKMFVENIPAKGATNINAALVKALNYFEDDDLIEEKEVHYGRIIVFLTDGHATEGVTSHTAILDNVKSLNILKESSIYTIAFGTNSDRDFLNKLSTQNGGKLIVIKENKASDVIEQLVSFFKVLENPAYRNLSFSFFADGVLIPNTNLTEFPKRGQYDCGSEVVFGGWTSPGAKVIPNVSAIGATETVVFDSIETVPVKDAYSDLLSRLVAYKRVKEILKTADTTTDSSIKEKANAEALSLSLKYQFVTPVTSMVISEVKRKKALPLKGPTNRADFGRSRSSANLVDSMYEYNYYTDLQNINNEQSTLVYNNESTTFIFKPATLMTALVLLYVFS